MAIGCAAASEGRPMLNILSYLLGVCYRTHFYTTNSCNGANNLNELVAPQLLHSNLRDVGCHYEGFVQLILGYITVVMYY